MKRGAWQGRGPAWGIALVAALVGLAPWARAGGPIAGAAPAAAPALDHASTQTASLALPAGTPATLADLRQAPLAVYQQSCVTCHGPWAAQHRKPVRALTEIGLKRSIRVMFSQQSHLQTTPAERDAMVALHRAVRQQPAGEDVPLFVAITNAASFTTTTQAAAVRELRGEATPGTQLALISGAGAARPITLTGTTWVVPAAPPPPFRIEGRLGTQRATLDFPHRQWTHADPPGGAAVFTR